MKNTIRLWESFKNVFLHTVYSVWVQMCDIAHGGQRTALWPWVSFFHLNSRGHTGYQACTANTSLTKPSCWQPFFFF